MHHMQTGQVRIKVSWPANTELYLMKEGHVKGLQ